jgi:hypothetical protein
MTGVIDQFHLFQMPTSGQTPEDLRKSRSGTFTDNMRLPVHRWFRYSAGFSADWVESLILEKSPAFVFDPFVGSGTTVLAASAVDVEACGYESHPFIARVARAKTYWDQSVKDFLYSANALLAFAQTIPVVVLETPPALLGKCYTPENLQKLYALRTAYDHVSKTMLRETSELLWLAITAILRSCSYVGTAQWQYVLPNKTKSKSQEPFQAFQKKITEMASDMLTFQDSKKINRATIFQHDARCTHPDLPENSVDLIITSPPYPNNYDYADATRLEMIFWGEIRGWGDLQGAVRQFIVRSSSQHATAEKLKLDTLLADPAIACIREELVRVCSQLAEIRLTKGGKKAYHTMIAAYFCDLAKAMKTMRFVCRTGATVCLVIGDSAPYGIYVPVDDWLGRLAIANGFVSVSFEKLRDRNTKWKNRKHQVPLQEGRLWIEG